MAIRARIVGIFGRRFAVFSGTRFDDVPAAIPIVFLLVLPLLLSGPIRTATKIGIEAALVCALFVSASLFWGMWRCIRPFNASRTTQWWRLYFLSEFAVICLPVFAIWRLWNSDFHGFPNIDGWDGGTHAFVKDRFIKENPGEYFGFVSQYGFCHWLEFLPRIDRFRSVVWSFYFAVATFAAACGLVAVTTIRRAFGQTQVAATLGLTTVVVIAVIVLDRGPFIGLHYLQGMGFYPQVFGVVGLCALWASDALIGGTGARLVAYGLSTALLRFGYGLNLPDAIAALGLVLLLEAQSSARATLLSVCGLAACAAAAYGFTTLEPLFSLWGGLAQHSVSQLQSLHLGLFLVSIVLVALLVPVLQAAGAYQNQAAVRAVRFPLAFVAVNGTACAYFQSIAKHYYYINKYQFAASCMIAGVIVVLAGFATANLTHVLASWRKEFRNRFWATLVAAAIALGMVWFAPRSWRHIFAWYGVSYKERIEVKGPPYALLRPTADAYALARMRRILKQENKAFGGYLTNNFPFFSFMNGALGFHSGVQDFFPPNKAPGHCVFWVSAQHDIYPLGPAASVNAWRDELAGLQQAACQEYGVRWKITPQSLCHICF